MADNINFIPASELPVTEAESGAVSFLCEENGEMKRFPGEKVGSSFAYDAEIFMSNESGEWVNELVSGSFEAIRTKVLAHEKPNIGVVIVDVKDDGSVWHETPSVYTVQACEIESEPVWVLVAYSDESWWVGINPDNTVFKD